MAKKKIDNEVDHCLNVLARLDPDSEEYGVVAGNLNIICEARSKKAFSKVDWNMVISAATGFGQILVIILHERLNVIATKAISFVAKSRL